MWRFPRPRSALILTTQQKRILPTRRLFAARAPPKKVVITARVFPQTIHRLKDIGLQVIHNESTEPWSRTELLHRSHYAHAMMAFMTDCVDEAFLEACPNLQLIACALKGFDNFDTKACAARGIDVTAVPDLLTAPTAELAVLLALGLGRRIREADATVRSGSFAGWRPRLYGTGLADATVGILGAGAVGLAVAERLRGFAPARILFVDPAADKDAATKLGLEQVEQLDDLLSKCDFLFVCTPLNPSTRHCIDSELLALAKPNLQLINISRGSCVKERHVADALEAGHLGGYAADVFEMEDWILDDRPRAIDPRLVAHPRTLFSPHLGSAVAATRQAIEMAAADEIVQWYKGLPPNVQVN